MAMAHVDVDALRDDQWERLRDLVPGGRASQRGPRCDNRLFVAALLWVARSGARWRDLPERFGDHQAVRRRHSAGSSGTVVVQVRHLVTVVRLRP